MALQVVGIGAPYISTSEVPSNVFDDLHAEVEKVGKGKPKEIISKIFESKKKTFLADKVLLESPFILSEEETPMKDHMARHGELEISRIDYWQVGNHYNWLSGK